jgi:uncharacterized protein YjdB
VEQLRLSAFGFSRQQWCALVLAVVVSACGETTTPAPAPEPEPTPDTVVSLQITGAPAEAIPVAETLQLTATVRDTAGNPVSRPVSWSSSNTAVAQVSDQGLLKAVQPGDAAITATAERRSTTIMVRVAQPKPPADVVASILISGVPSLPLPVAATAQLTAIPRDAAGNPVDRPVRWSSSNTAIAEVSAQGLLRAVSLGEVSISATSERHTATVVVRVGESTPPVDTVASILISGVPASPLPALETAQLTATPRDAAGNAVDRPVSWASSNTAIAEVNAQGLLRAVSAGEVSISATSERHTATVVVRTTVARVASVTLEGVPTGQVPMGSTVQLTATPRDVQGNPIPGRTITWASSNTARAQVSSTGLVSAMQSGQVTITATSEGKSASAPITIYAPVNSVTVSPSSAGLYATQQLQLQAVVKDANGTVLTDRVPTWTSSDTSVATVDATGKVTAVGAGQALLTASSEGKSGTANLRVIARPTASWRQTAEWSTFQGNARHTGAVQATLDPLAFRELWVSQAVPAGSALNPVTEGGGSVFATTKNYFSNQQLTVLNAQTGQTQWTYSFGGISSVHPPAYGNGIVYLTTGGHQDSFLYAFDAATSTLRFRSAYGNQWSSYYAPVVEGGTVYMAGGYYDGMYAFNATSGEQTWFATTNQYDEWTPAVANGQVFAYTGSYSPKLQVVNASTGTLAYEIADPNFNWNGWSMNLSPVLGGSQNVLATQAGRLLSFDLQNRQIGWTKTGSFTGNVTVANGVLYVFNNQQLEARSEADGSLLWIWVPPEGTPTGTTIVTDNLIFVSTASYTYAVDLGARVHMWRYPAGGQLALSKDGTLFIARSNGSLVAIAVK